MTTVSISPPRSPSTVAGHPGCAIVLRAAIIAAVLGSLLTLTNQWDAVTGQADFALLPLALVYATPFVVVALSQVMGMRRARSDIARRLALPRPGTPLWRTMVGHGIPHRAALTAVAAGTLNSTIVAAALLAEHGSLAAFPPGLAMQAFTLPLLFGLLSQAIAYRRAALTPR